MEKTAFKQFKSEVGHFFRVSVLNIAFAALLMTFGLMVVVREIVFIYETFTTEMAILYSPIILIVAVCAIVIGYSWIVTSARIFEGVEEIKDEIDRIQKEQKGKEMAVPSGTAPEDGLPEEDLSRPIVRMLSHYRDNRATINRMIAICMLGSVTILLLGILASLEYFQVSESSLTITIGQSTLLLPSLLITVAIAFVSLISSIYFFRFARVWDERISEIDHPG